MSLKLKTYFSSTVEAAVDLARRELGSDAMLVNSRKAPDEVRHLGTYEVIFATGTPPEPKHSRPAPTAKAAINSASDTDRQLAEIREQLASLRHTLRPPHSPEASPLQQELEAAGVEPSLTRELLQAIHRTVPAPNGPERLREALIAEMDRRLTTDSVLMAPGSARSLVALAGPPGRGKSTTLVKLAVTQGLARRIPVRILSIDNFRIGAGEQMRSFAAILGVPFQACASTAELDQHLGTSGLNLIDTSGYGPAEREEASALANYFSGHPEIDVHLVLRADAKAAEGIAAVHRFSDFNVSKLIFTGIDEAESFGSVFSVAAQTRKPISFFGSGQSIPEDLQLAAEARLVHRLMETHAAPAFAAA